MPMTVRGSFALAILLCAGCLPGPEPDLTVEGEPELVHFVSVGHGRQASVDTTTLRVIAHASEWEAYQDSLRPLMPFHAVDFDLEMVLLAAVSVITSGHDLRFELVEVLNDTVTCHVSQVSQSLPRFRLPDFLCAGGRF